MTLLGPLSRFLIYTSSCVEVAHQAFTVLVPNNCFRRDTQSDLPPSKPPLYSCQQPPDDPRCLPATWPQLSLHQVDRICLYASAGIRPSTQPKEQPKTSIGKREKL